MLGPEYKPKIMFLLLRYPTTLLEVVDTEKKNHESYNGKRAYIPIH
jgi:hypothetical protein